jgi:hypothetical protein
MIKLFLRIKQAFIELMFKPAHIAIVALVGTYTLLWGLWIAVPGWEVFTTAMLYENMLTLAPEIVWGSIAALIGAVACYGAATHSYICTRLSGSLIWAYWFVIAILYLSADWHNTGGITALFFMVYGAYIFINTKLNRDMFVQKTNNKIKKQYE